MFLFRANPITERPPRTVDIVGSHEQSIYCSISGRTATESHGKAAIHWWLVRLIVSREQHHPVNACSGHSSHHQNQCIDDSWCCAGSCRSSNRSKIAGLTRVSWKHKATTRGSSAQGLTTAATTHSCLVRIRGSRNSTHWVAVGSALTLTTLIRFSVIIDGSEYFSNVPVAFDKYSDTHSNVTVLNTADTATMDVFISDTRVLYVASTPNGVVKAGFIERHAGKVRHCKGYLGEAPALAWYRWCLFETHGRCNSLCVTTCTIQTGVILRSPAEHNCHTKNCIVYFLLEEAMLHKSVRADALTKTRERDSAKDSRPRMLLVLRSWKDASREWEISASCFSIVEALRWTTETNVSFWER